MKKIEERKKYIWWEKTALHKHFTEKQLKYLNRILFSACINSFGNKRRETELLRIAKKFRFGWYYIVKE